MEPACNLWHWPSVLSLWRAWWYPSEASTPTHHRLSHPGHHTGTFLWYAQVRVLVWQSPERSYYRRMCFWRRDCDVVSSSFSLLFFSKWISEADSSFESLYWLGLYETSSTKVYPWFFHVDYSDKFSHSKQRSIGVNTLDVQYLLFSLSHSSGFLAFSVIGKVTFYIMALAICCGVTTILYYLTTLFFNFQWAQSMFPLFPIVGYTTSAMIAGLMLSIFISGAGWCCILVFMLFRMAVRSPFGRYVLRMAGPRYLEGRVRSLYVEYWLPPTSRLHRTPSFYLRRVLIRQREPDFFAPRGRF